MRIGPRSAYITCLISHFLVGLYEGVDLAKWDPTAQNPSHFPFPRSHWEFLFRASHPLGSHWDPLGSHVFPICAQIYRLGWIIRLFILIKYSFLYLFSSVITTSVSTLNILVILFQPKEFIIKRSKSVFISYNSLIKSN